MTVRTQKGTGGYVDLGERSGEQQRWREKELDERAGPGCPLQRPTVWRQNVEALCTTWAEVVSTYTGSILMDSQEHLSCKIRIKKSKSKIVYHDPFLAGDLISDSTLYSQTCNRNLTSFHCNIGNLIGRRSGISWVEQAATCPSKLLSSFQGRGGVPSKVLYGEAPPQGPASYHFDRYPFVTFYWKSSCQFHIVPNAKWNDTVVKWICSKYFNWRPFKRT